MSGALSVIGNMISQLFSVQMPWGIAWGYVIVGVATMPILLAIIKKIF